MNKLSNLTFPGERRNFFSRLKTSILAGDIGRSVLCPDQRCHQSGPAGLVGRTHSATAVPVEVFVKQDVLIEIRVGLKRGIVVINRPSTAGIFAEDRDQPSRPRAARPPTTLPGERSQQDRFPRNWRSSGLGEAASIHDCRLRRYSQPFLAY